MNLAIEIEEFDKNCTVNLSGKLNIYSVKEFYESVTSLLPSYNNFQFNFSKVEELDASGAQALLYIKKHFKSKNRKIQFTGHSISVLKTMEVLGLVAIFGDKIHISKENVGMFQFSYGMKKLGHTIR
ncbi:MAG: STAS domain-containing protein [Leptospiraceae bacterium]|nr:STAS domain-containing protein [Leptospiraceae bacterium]